MYVRKPTKAKRGTSVNVPQQTAKEEKFSKTEAEAAAEIALMGVATPVYSEAQLKCMVDHVCFVLEMGNPDEILENALHKYNSEELPVSWFIVNVIYDMPVIAFARESELVNPDGSMNEDGILCWNENLRFPDCSELGYVFFQSDEGGYIHRIS